MQLPTEQEIINRVKADWSKPKVAFLCITYNQQDYIEDTIKGFLIQKTSFPYEIIIHDDCSTDKTRDVIDSYKAKYPNLIKTIYQKQNQYSQGNSVTLIAAKQARAEYIALCEGDDYWINENKIENQLDLMLDNPLITMVVSPSKIELNNKIIKENLGQYGSKIKTVLPQDILDVSGQFAPTSSYILKRESLIESTELFSSAPVGDLFIELYCAVQGKLVYFPEVGSVYRLMAKGSWTEDMNNNQIKKQIEFTQAMESTIKYSKTIRGFENLDWSTKKSLYYYVLARKYLKGEDFRKFKQSIEQSYNYKHLSKGQYIFYRLRNSKISLSTLENILSIKNKISNISFL